MTTAHTATPLKAHKAQGSLLTNEIFDANDAPFAQIKATPEKVEFIVRACNAHDDLLKALEFCAAHAYAGGRCFGDLPIVKDALAKAKGGAA